MGWWGAFQGIALFFGVGISAVLLNATQVTWNIWWFIMGAVTLVFIPVILARVPADTPSAVNLQRVTRLIATTVKTPLPWAFGIIFSSTHTMGRVLGFLPVCGKQIESTLDVALLVGSTAVVGGLNGVANVVTGILLQRGQPPRRLMLTGLATMAATSVIVFAPDWSVVPGNVVWALLAAAVFSFMGALVPTTVTRQAVDIAPAGGSPAAVIGLMTQMYNLANFLGPVIISHR